MQVGEPNPKTVGLFVPVSIFKFGVGKLLSLFQTNILFVNVTVFEIGTKNDGKLRNVLFVNMIIFEIEIKNDGKLQKVLFVNVTIFEIGTKNDSKLRNVSFDKVTTFEIGIRNGGKFIYAQLFSIVLFDKLLLSLRVEIFKGGKLSLLNNNYFMFVSFSEIGTSSRDFKHFPKGKLCVSQLFFKKKQFKSGTIDDDCQLFDKRSIYNLTLFEIGRVCVWEFCLRIFLVIIWLFAICDKMSVEADKFCDKIRVTALKYLCDSVSENLYSSEFAKAKVSVTKLAGEKIIFFDISFNFLLFW